ncbi:MAG: hypothetical protein QGG40_01585, partial [Myxococcota bacterium]|nr:hypothetical protein [Myxococcota bacterium]
ELMPVGLGHHVVEDPDLAHEIYNQSDEASIQALAEAGAIVLQAHTEGKPMEDLQERVGWGMSGIEIFNLHAMFDPTKREEDLGLDPYQWSTDIAPFTAPDGTAEPDLLFLAVHQEQTPSIQKWDALQSQGPVFGVAGTDAHQNVLPYELRDGERLDSYRRMLRWFSNVLLTEGIEPHDYDEALSAGRGYVAFEILGTPVGFDLVLRDADDRFHEMGATAPTGTLEVTCPELSADSPRGELVPEWSVTIFHDGEPWQEGCGSFEITEAGTYRVRVDIVPWHLTDFLGEDPDAWLHSYPWIYSNPIHVEF